MWVGNERGVREVKGAEEEKNSIDEERNIFMKIKFDHLPNASGYIIGSCAGTAEVAF